MSFNTSNLLYLITMVTFILALRFLSSPAHARRGNQIGAAGMLVAVVVTWVNIGTTSWWAIAIGMVIGGGFGAVAARKVKMTAMPQMVAPSAISIPAAAVKLPLRALFGELSCFRPRMNSTAATRYASVMATVLALISRVAPPWAPGAP